MGVDHYMTSVIVDEFSALDSREEAPPSPQTRAETRNPKARSTAEKR